MPADYPSLSQCGRCGKLFHREPARTLCHACAGEPAPVSEAVFNEELGLITEAQRRFAAIMRRYDEESGNAAPPPETPADTPGCTLCGRPRTGQSELCIECKTHLHGSLGDAASELVRRLESTANAPARVRSVLHALEEARARTAMSRINPVGVGRLRT